jgi:hypothetical protein
LTVTLRATIPAPERILAFGGPGAGKTTNILHIARRVPDATFYVIDSDGAFQRMLSGSNADLKNIDVTDVYEWPEYTNALDRVLDNAKPGDWVVSDMINPAWEAVQSFFTDQVFGKDIDRFFLEARAASKKGSAFDGRKDWTVINKLYRNWANRLTLKASNKGVHTYATASVTGLQDDDDKKLIETFGRYGMKPTGQKENPHRFHTILWMTRSKAGGWQATTVKDREREELDHHTITNFATDYLVKVAGWKPARIETAA